MTGTARRRARLAVLPALLAALVLAGAPACGQQRAGGPAVSGSSDDGSGAAVPTASTTPRGPTPGALTGARPQVGGSLRVEVDDGGAVRTWTLTCAPDGTPGGDHPDAAGACAAIAAAPDPFAPVPPDRACTQVYGGPQRATVTGTWAGREVSATFSRTDGCEIERWERLAPLLQPDPATAHRASPPS
ncbi:SSI family serine proteinase inhibitor [Kineococcus gypseus]|uniref:SSI family serine proteinase inhibitor n=1 Tax=Kineococcus gypseus TaxID=1637102 RepID=UPI003D7EA602